MSGVNFFNASSLTKNAASMALSYPQKRTAWRVASNERLRFGKLSAMVHVAILSRLEILRINGHHLYRRRIIRRRGHEDHRRHPAIDGKRQSFDQLFVRHDPIVPGLQC